MVRKRGHLFIFYYRKFEELEAKSVADQWAPQVLRPLDFFVVFQIILTNQMLPHNTYTIAFHSTKNFWTHVTDT